MGKRGTFFSFHYKPDNWRAAQVRNMGVVEGNSPVSDNDWEDDHPTRRCCDQGMDRRSDVWKVLCPFS